MMILLDREYKNAEIDIVSGEGVIGTREKFRGRKTKRAIKQRIKKETCQGDRWARAEIIVDGYKYMMNEKGEIHLYC